MTPRSWEPNKLRKMERTLRAAAEILPKIEPFIRYAGGPIDDTDRRRRGTIGAVCLLREAADYVQSLPLAEGGRNTDFDEAWCVSLMCDAYRRKTGKPHYVRVTNTMLKEFPELFKKKPKDKESWARDRYRIWKHLQTNKKAWERLMKERARLEILYGSPSLTGD